MIAAALLSLSLTLSTSDAGAQGAYARGAWAEAETAAREISDAETRTLAAQAALAPLILGEMASAPRSERRAAARRAQTHARAALELDPDHAPAHLRLAAALGFEARYVSPVRAALMGLPQEGKRHIETAITIDPDDPWGHALLGAWHLEVARRGRPGLFGSDANEGLTRYRAAMGHAGDDPSIAFHFALALIAADPQAHGDEALALLDLARAADAPGAFEDAIRAGAGALRALLDRDRSAAQAEAIRRLEE
ncbi:MAG: hypothetical protein ACXIVL_08840 [Oceanicaulis sp.]